MKFKDMTLQEAEQYSLKLQETASQRKLTREETLEAVQFCIALVDKLNEQFDQLFGKESR